MYDKKNKRYCIFLKFTEKVTFSNNSKHIKLFHVRFLWTIQSHILLINPQKNLPNYQIHKSLTLKSHSKPTFCRYDENETRAKKIQHTSSKLNRTPPIGAPNATDTPAADAADKT